MTKKQALKPHSAAKQKDYERVARLQYGPDTVNESIQRWNSYSKAEQERILAESNQVYRDLAAAIDTGLSPQSAEVQAILERWHDNLHYFYEPTLEIVRGLAELYNSEPGFIANFQKLHADLPAFLQQGITEYADQLENAEIARLMAEDEGQQKRINRLGGS